VDSLRVAVLAALNLADELSRAEQADGGDARLAMRRAVSLRGLLDEVLEKSGRQVLIFRPLRITFDDRVGVNLEARCASLYLC